jgi:uncharacterized membrane protein YfcA
VTLPHIATLLLAAAGAGAVDAIVGGGGLILLPALLVAFPSTATATLLGTNKLTAIAGTATAAGTYLRRTTVDWRLLGPTAALALVFSAIGGLLAGSVPAQVYRPVVIVVLAGVAVVVIARPGFGTIMHEHPRTRARVLATTLLAGVGIALYDGAIGPGTGSFLLLAFTGLLGIDFLHGSAMAKTVNVATNLGALLVFAATGHVLWLLGGAMAVANIAGAQVGARLAIHRGTRFIRAVLLIVVLTLLAKLAYDQYLS